MTDGYYVRLLIATQMIQHGSNKTNEHKGICLCNMQNNINVILIL